jgi:hypothetical protein
MLLGSTHHFPIYQSPWSARRGVDRLRVTTTGSAVTIFIRTSISQFSISLGVIIATGSPSGEPVAEICRIVIYAVAAVASTAC